MTDQGHSGTATYFDGHPVVQSGRIGVLLVNVGTPEATSYWAMRRYLKEFLSDPRVVDRAGPVWWFILNAIILRRKPHSSGKAYSKIWNRRLNESPLRTITRNQSERLQARLAATVTGNQVDVAWAMRYGEPAIGPTLASLQERGCERVLLVPLYPQYSAATTATAQDKAFEALQRMRWQPAIRTMPAYYNQPSYIETLAESLRGHLATLSHEPDMILLSFHGLPREFLAKGDPYYCQCHKTGRLLRQSLGYEPEKVLLTFQSQTRRKEWHQPFTNQTVIKLAREGTKRLPIVTPGFAADCVETLEEIAVRARDGFHRHGGENFSVVSCLNDSDTSIEMLSTLVCEQLQGWL